jgi:anaerobic magnesium-protoporphyrin IX monomethyl ester cyclase
MEIVPIDITHYTETKEIRFIPTVMIAYFDPIQWQTMIFSAPLSSLQ